VLAARDGDSRGEPRSHSSPDVDDALDARVWGVHFRFSDDVGARQGAEVADYELPRLGSLSLW
jgi:hypothetical protein